MQTGPAGDYPGTLTAGPYQVVPDPSGDTWNMKHRQMMFTAISLRKNAAVTQDEVLQIIGGLQISDQLNDPSAWSR